MSKIPPHLAQPYCDVAVMNLAAYPKADTFPPEAIGEFGTLVDKCVQQGVETVIIDVSEMRADFAMQSMLLVLGSKTHKVNVWLCIGAQQEDIREMIEKMHIVGFTIFPNIAKALNTLQWERLSKSSSPQMMM